MSQTITEAFVEQYTANFMTLAQQKESRFSVGVDMDSNIVGASKAVERIGSVDAFKITTRHADTKFADVPHSRRWIDLEDWSFAELVDDLDKVRMLIDPTSEYVQAAVMSLNRAKDDAIIAAMSGSAREQTTGLVALPAAQKIAVGVTNLTVAKLISARELLDAADIDPDEERYIAVAANQISALLGDSNITSADFNTVRALVAGEIDTYMGFKFIRTERLNSTGNSRFCPVWAKTGVRLGIGQEINADVSIRNDKNNSTQVFAKMSIGAVRVEDVRVVEIACDETA